MQVLGTLILKRNVTSNRLEKCMSFSITYKLSFINCFPFLSASLDRLVKNLSKDDFKYLCQEFDRNVLGLVK